jgi:hypothetical protein
MMARDHARVGSIWMSASSPFDRVAIDIRISRREAESLVQPVGGFTRWPRTEFYGSSSALGTKSERLAAQRLSHATPTRGLVNCNIFDPGSHPSRNTEHDKSQHANDHQSCRAGASVSSLRSICYHLDTPVQTKGRQLPALCLITMTKTGVSLPTAPGAITHRVHLPAATDSWGSRAGSVVATSLLFGAALCGDTPA